MTQHSREDALSERKFQLLLEGARELPAPQDFEARLCILLAGRLGLRGGEICHLSTDWIDPDRRMIEIPQFDPCTKGEDGGPCGYCVERARVHLDCHNLSMEEAREVVREETGSVDLADEKIDAMAQEKREEHNKTMEEALAERWEPKTDNGARSVPFDFEIRTQLAIERFADRYDVFPRSRMTVNRRVKAAARQAGIEDRIYPHALRATAANSLALHDVSSYSLMGIMGWADIETARAYIQASDENAAKEIRSKYR